VKPTDPRYLKDGDLDTREERLYQLVKRCEAGAGAGEVGDAVAADAEAAARVLRAMVRDYPDYHRTLYTRAMNRIVLFGDASLEAPLLAALADTRYNCQAWAAMGCRGLGFRSAVPGLLSLLDSPQWLVQQEATIALGELGDSTVVPHLAPLLRDPTQSVREHAAEALSRIGGDEALAALWDEFEHRRFSRIGYIASGLALFTPEVIPRLLEMTANPDPNLRYWAAVALGSTGDPQVAPTLERLQAEDRGSTVFDGEVRAAAKKALRTLGRIQAAIAARTP
jgi:HEAT repeat protein